MDLSLSLLLLAALGVNIPFGYWRQGLPKFSKLWFLAVHLPVPFVIVLRIVFGVGLFVVPLTLAFSIFGQILGGKLRNKYPDSHQLPVK